MAISIGDMVMLLRLDKDRFDYDLKDADAEMKEFYKEQQKEEEKRRADIVKAGTIMTGIGASITAVLGLSIKAAADEEAGIVKLSQSLKTVGVNYDDVKKSLEGVISATQTKTSVADEKQREALSRLIGITNDYQKSLDLLPLALDLARAKDMDLVSASEIVGKVAQGNTGILSRYGIVLKEGATASEALAEMQKKFAGQAEAYGKTVSGQFELLQNNIGNLTESIGATLLPIISDLFKNYITPFIEKLKAWAEENPELLKTIVIVVAAVGGLLTVLGPLLIMLPGIITLLPLLGTAFTLATGPVGIIIAAIGALIAIGVLVVQNWDWIAAKSKDIWGGIVSFFKGVWNVLVSGFESYINMYIGGINAIINLINKIPGVNLGTIGPFDLSGIKAYAEGGLITEPTLLTSLRTGRTYGVAGERGTETISPSGGNTVNIYNPVVRSDNDIQEITKQIEQVMYRHQQSRLLQYGT